MNLASGGMRVAARLIDGLIMVVIFVPLWFLVFATTETGNGQVNTSVGFGGFIGLTLLALGVGFANEIVLVALKGGSAGKLILGLRVVKASGGPADWGTAFVRYSPNLVSVIPCLGSILGFVLTITNLVLVFSDTNHQSVYDKVAKTYVIATR